MDSNLARAADRFLENPGDTRAFAELEEHHFLQGEWPELVKLYERRLAAPDLQDDAGACARMSFRLGQVLEERCLQVDRAVERYQDAARLAPEFRPPLQQLRRIHVGREAWNLVLEVADQEADLPMQPFERAEFCAQMGEIWHRHMSDGEKGAHFYDRALEADPGHISALLGLAALREEQEDVEGAASALERVVEHTKGPEQSRPLAALATLYQTSLDQPERAEELFRLALAADPRCVTALAALTKLATARESWTEACEFLAQRFHLVTGATPRLAIAQEAGRISLRELRDPQSARFWFDRARELFPNDASVMLELADVERLAGNRDALGAWLERAILISATAVPVDGLLESAQMRSESDPEGALDTVRLALTREPDHVEGLELESRLLDDLGRNTELATALVLRAEAAAGEPLRAAQLWTQVGSLRLSDENDETEAIAAFERALAARPDTQDAVDALLRLHESHERLDAQRELLERAAPAASGRRALALRTRLGELLLGHFDAPDDALAAFQSALEADPSDPRALQGLERVALASGDEDTILEAFEREAAVTTDRARLTFLVWELSRILETRDQPDEALLWLERLVQVAPEQRDVLENCSRLQEQLGHDEELVATLERLDVLLRGTEQAANRRRLAELHNKSGDVAAAVDAYRHALQADPEDLASLRALLEPLERTGQLRELADTHAALAERVAGGDRVRHLSARADLLEDPLDDLQGALVSLELLTGELGSTPEREDRIADLLDRSGRHQELADRLTGRLAGEEAEDALLELRLCELLGETLGQAGAALERLERLEARADLDEDLREPVLEAFERALRIGGDGEALARFLERRAESATDPETAARLHLERAGLLCELGRPEEARALYEALADESSASSSAAESRLEELLERSGAWDGLCRRLEAKLDGAAADAKADLHERIAALRRDRLGDRSGAIRSFEAAAERAPNRVSLWQALARLYTEEDRRADLLNALESELAAGTEAKRKVLLHARAAELCRAEGTPTRAMPHFRALLELDPVNASAAEFLAEQLEADENWTELAAVLTTRLEHLNPAGPDDTTALRLRLAALHGGPLADPDAAIALLEPTFAQPESLPLVAEPLADLLTRAGRREELTSVCRDTIAALRDPAERAPWSLRLGDALLSSDQLPEAADAYRQVLADRPGDPDAERALRDVYRSLGEARPLSRLLEAELQSVAGAQEISIRQELAGLFAGPLERPAEALSHLRRVIDLEPGHGDAIDRALALSRELGAHTEQLGLIEVALARTPGPVPRAILWTERARLLAGPLDRAGEAIDAYDEALRADPSQRELWVELRDILDARGDTADVLRTLEAEAALLPPDARGPLYEAGAQRAEAAGPNAVIPWLTRLRNVQPGSADVLARISDVQRRRDDPAALALALREEIAAAPDAERRAALQRELATLYEDRLEAPGRGLSALEACRRETPRDPELLEALENRYAATGRSREQVEVLAARIDVAEDGAADLRRALAQLQRRALGEPSEAAETLWALLTAAETRGVVRTEVLRELGDTLRETGRSDLWAEVTEEELRALRDGDGVVDERRHELQRELGEAYEGILAQPDRALPHWRELVDHGPTASLGQAEDRLLAGLRRTRDDVELATRLDARLERDPTEPKLWLELARLYEERLHRPTRAATAYSEVLGAEPESLDALRGLRRTSARLGRPTQLAETLETELGLDIERTPAETAALWRGLGEVAWHRLDSTTRASRAFASALEADPQDLASLRSLQTLFEGMEDWRGALDLFESEVAVLGDGEPKRRQELWLRAGAMASNRTEDDDRALRSYEAAAEIGELPLPRQYEWAELYERVGGQERFVEVLSDWCDDPDASPDAAEWLRLASALEALDRGAEALERTQRAVDADPEHGVAWDELARRHESAQAPSEAASALVHAASCRQGQAAADRLARAAEWLAAEDLERSAELLGRAVTEDPAHGIAQAALAARCGELGRLDQAREAALLAIDLVETERAAEPDMLLAACLAGAAGATRDDEPDAARRLLEAALTEAPEHPEALSSLAELLVGTADWPAARSALKRRLAVAEADPEATPAERAALEAQLGGALEALDEPSAALARYTQALELDPNLDAAYAGLARRFEAADRAQDAVDILQRWALRTGESGPRADRLLRAAELELARDGREEPAEHLLREATALAPDRPIPWVRLANLLASEGRTSESLEAATRALEAVPEPAPERADLHQARGEALEKRGERSAAAAAYADSVAIDPTRATSALAAARLLRASGEWSAAARGLEEFLAAAAGSDASQLADAWYQLGRLRAGPLEDVEGSIKAYREALSSDAERNDAREALSELLVHVPDEWDEAITRHAELLAENPGRLASLRGLLRIARGRELSDAISLGCSLLEGLGTATSSEKRETPKKLFLSGNASGARLDDPIFEAARRLAQEAAREIGDALGTGTPADTPSAPGDPVARFRAELVSEEGRLSAPALVPRPDTEVGVVLRLVAQLVCDAEEVEGDGDLVNDLSRQLGRRARRRVRKALGETSAEDLATLDVGAWRAELRALAAAQVLEREGLDLRSAWISRLDLSEADIRALTDGSDITELVLECAETRALLRRIVDAWIPLLRS